VILVGALVALTVPGPLLVPPASAVGERRPAVLVLVPDLLWRDAPPDLAGFAKASLSVRAAPTRSGPADGYLTIGKGARSGAPTAGTGAVVELPDGGWRVEDWARLRRHDRGLRYAGELGALGEALRRAGLRWLLVGEDRRAATAAADAAGIVPRAVSGGSGAVPAALAEDADAVIVSVPATEVGAVMRAVGGTRCAIVASVSTPRLEHLGVFATSPACGFGRAGLTSSSTQQPSLVTLPDVTSTFLAVLGVTPPENSSGSVAQASGAVSADELVDRDRRASVADRTRTPLVWLFVGMHALVAVVVVGWRRARRLGLLVLLAVPPASFLIMATPWWRWGFGGAVLAGGLLAAALAGAAWVVTGDDLALAAALLLATTAAVIGIDALFRGPLEVDAPFGNSPIRGGRYFGVGNIGFAFLAAALIVAGAFALDRWGRRAVPWVLAALAAGIVVDGAPWFGADAGGVAAAVPAFGLLLVGQRRGGRTVRNLMLVVAVACLAVLAFAVLDAIRPEASRTHLGRALTGEGDIGNVVARKASRALATLKTPMANIAWVGALALLVARPRFSGRPALRAGAWALLAVAVLGSAVNDSGLQVAAAAAAIGWPACLAIGESRLSAVAS
jgi:hypothetical protein